MEMAKTGLPAGKRVDIPFGIRAIQSGVEVDGIWISCPGTPTEVGRISPSFASSSTLETETKLKGKEKESTATNTDVEPTPEQSPQPSPALSALQRHTLPGADPSHPRVFPLSAQSTYRPKGPSHRRTDITADDIPDVDLLDRPERNLMRHQQVETYIPTNSFSSGESSESSQQRTMVERSSTSSDEGARHSSSRYVSHLRRSAITTPQAFNSSDSSEPPASHVDFFGEYTEQRRNPFETPSEKQQVPRPPLAASRPTPHRSYSGDSHANTASRKVNAGFEVLPAGTFSRSNSQNEMEDSQSRRHSNNKIQKKSRDRTSRDRTEMR
ncbi:uncharacterized protein GGS22DRAFT_168599 [Annulohypoxylon maeteangense]|uniref:uncharacterized protein n=1 Tax=Annulohypoxylon maeteangense TaxID=1927788 RepID=UPI0020083A36|nr:uncharacterized protein GGS22DRAFT_168599 [Annulohypoxylon maeteangense]KAI0882734.1 hypothetical protein GGS22DRAFT_168599 [Annulohypoxylon maeteangense]